MRAKFLLALALAVLGAGCGGQTADCSKYIDCVEAQFPGSRSQIDATYGPSGSCWTGTATTANACNDQCRAGLAAARNGSNPPAACL
jgi:hypothetical protein